MPSTQLSTEVPSKRRSLKIGLFSDSAVIHAIRHLGLDSRAGLNIETIRVPSSPGAFAWLRDREINAVVTSPDNVLLYATTDKQPLGHTLDVRMLRSVDRGMGLALFSRPNVESIDDFCGKEVAVDVVRSGFALLLFQMLAKKGVERSAVKFMEAGPTPQRLHKLQEGAASATVLNAESRIAAQELGMREWITSADISGNYLGGVLAACNDFEPSLAAALADIWSQATVWLLDAPVEQVLCVLSQANPALGTPGYVQLLRDNRFGLTRDPQVHQQELEELCRIRREAGAYAPTPDFLQPLCAAL